MIATIVGAIIWIICLIGNIKIAQSKNRSSSMGCPEHLLFMDCTDH